MIKKSMKVLSSVALVGILAVASTKAFLSFTTNEATNVFTASENISILLREPLWDGYSFTDTVTENQGKDINPDATNPQALGLTKALSYLPGDTIPKDPTIKNTNTDIKVHVALKLKFYAFDKEITFDEFTKDYATIKMSEKFTKIGDTSDNLYQFNELVDVGNTTDPLFTEVKVNSDIVFTADKLPNFHVVITGYAVQEMNDGTGTQQLIDLAKK